MLKVLFIRHGMTPGNKLSRYIGCTDEPLSEEGKNLLREKKEKIRAIGQPVLLFTSPMLRCRETAEILYPEISKIQVTDLREFDFGIFENKNYKELSSSAEYQAWIDSMCEAQVPGGESMESFKNRCNRGFSEVLELCRQKGITEGMIALTVHGGTIMSLMETFSDEKKSYYDWSVKNGEGYFVEVDYEVWNEKKEFHIVSKVI